MRERGIEMYRNEDPSQTTWNSIFPHYIYSEKKSVQSANACSIWRNIHLFAEEGSYQNTQLPLHPKHICSLDNLSKQFLKVRNGFFFPENLDYQIYFPDYGTLKYILLFLLVTSQVHTGSVSGYTKPQRPESQGL